MLSTSNPECLEIAISAAKRYLVDPIGVFEQNTTQFIYPIQRYCIVSLFLLGGITSVLSERIFSSDLEADEFLKQYATSLLVWPIVLGEFLSHDGRFYMTPQDKKRAILMLFVFTNMRRFHELYKKIGTDFIHHFNVCYARRVLKKMLFFSFNILPQALYLASLPTSSR